MAYTKGLFASNESRIFGHEPENHWFFKSGSYSWPVPKYNRDKKIFPNGRRMTRKKSHPPAFGFLMKGLGELPVKSTAGCVVTLGDFSPVDGVPPGGDVIDSLVLIFQIVGVFPYVNTQDGCGAVHQGAVLIRA